MYFYPERLPMVLQTSSGNGGPTPNPTYPRVVIKPALRPAMENGEVKWCFALELAAIGEAHGKSAAQVAIAWLAQRGLVVIPKSVTAARVVANRDVDFALTPEDMAKVDGLNKDFRNGWGGPKVNRDGAEQPRDGLHPLYPFTQPGVAF